MSKLFLFDIEGTTTDINFVHKILFPYSKERLPQFVRDHESTPAVQAAITSVKETVQQEEKITLDLEGVITKLNEWIANDRKHGALKELQGLIWDKGYSENDFRGHVYPDVKPFFEKLKNSGAQIGIYSSGSVHAQKLIFGFSEAGDLTPYISYYFDTKVGAKREKNSYVTIAHETKIESSNIHFFSDIPQELEAAKEAGFQISHVVREGTQPSHFPMIKNFSEF